MQAKRKEEKLTCVHCVLADCISYVTQPDQPGKIFCSHPEKPYHLNQVPCPLYRMDWEKKMSLFE